MTTMDVAPNPPSAPRAADDTEPTLATYLKENPWPAEWTRLGEPIDYLWTFDVDVKPEELWPYVADTSSFNRRAGFAEMRFTEKDGKRFGSSVTAGTQMAWEEVPWEWQAGRMLGNTRIYSQGFLQVVRTRYLLRPRGENGSRLHVYMGVVPRGFKGRLFTKLGMSSMEKSFHKAFAEIGAAIQNRIVLPPEPVSPMAEGGLAKLLAGRDVMVRAGVDAGLVDRMVKYVQETPDGEIDKIRVKRLARAWRVDERKLLVAFLHATRQGLMLLTWDVVCPHCRGSRADVAHLGDVPKRAACDVCGIDFETTNVNSLEVTFHVHPSVRPVEKRLFCAAEPALKSHILVQKTLAPGTSITLDASLSPGRHRMRLNGSTAYTFLDVVRGAPERELEWTDAVQMAPATLGEHPRLILRNTSQMPRTFVLERTDEDRDALRPVDLFGIQEFRDLFSEEAVASDLHLDIGQQTILFTDLVGSTRFYEEQGDTVAFAEVRRHFVTAFEIVQRHQGVVVKTIGDAVMAAFPNPVQALRASADLQKFFDGKRPDTRLRVRVTIHTGPCVAVNLNNNIDYFGSTVNFAAKIQAIAEGGQVGFSSVVHADPVVQKWLAEEHHSVETLDFSQKWSGASVKVHRITVS